MDGDFGDAVASWVSKAMLIAIVILLAIGFVLGRLM